MGSNKMKSLGPILTVLMVIFAFWYLMAIKLNSQWEYDQAVRAKVEVGFWDILPNTMQQKKPVLPAPHQVLTGLWDGLAGQPITSKRSLVYHAWITLSGTIYGFVIGTAMGILLAVGIVYNRAMDLSVMPWAIASQMIPIIAIAPMLAVVVHALGASAIVTKAVISAYLSFFPILVGMVKGLRAPEQMQIDLLHTYSASKTEILWKLRFPASVPFLFTSLQVGIAASLVGAIVGELNQPAGLGARLLQGTYHGLTVHIWAALIVASLLAAILVKTIQGLERITLVKMGMRK